MLLSQDLNSDRKILRLMTDDIPMCHCNSLSFQILPITAGPGSTDVDPFRVLDEAEAEIDL